MTPGRGLRGGPRRNIGPEALLAAALAAMPFLAAPASAQDPVPDELTFQEAVDLALRNNPAYLRQVNQVSSAEQNERQSLGSMLPSLNASLGFNGNTSRNKTAFDELGRPLEEPDFVKSTRSSASQGVSGNVALFDLQAIRDYGAARARTAVQEAAVDLQAAQLRTAVGQQYYRAVQRQRLIDVEERGLATAQEQLEAIRRLLRVAAKQPTDVLGAELQVAQAEQSLAQARGEGRKALLTLSEGMGVALSADYRLASEFPRVFDPSTLDTQSLIDRAVREGPRLRQGLAQVEAAERSLSAARATRYPSLSGGYNYGRSTSRSDYDAFGDFNPENSGWGFSLSLSMPVFNGFRAGSAIGRASLEADDARQSLREARLALEREVRSARIDLENAYTAVQLAERSVEIAREQLAQGQELYRVGTLGYTDLQRMVDQVSQNERQLINAYYSFADALLQLEEKVGGPVGS